VLKPERTHPAEPGVVFFAMPFGHKSVDGGEPCDFDTIYASAFAPTVQACGMKPERLDNLYGPQGVLELIWRAIQRAEIVVIDFSLRNANVTFEYGLAWTLGKRVIALTQDEDDIPSDVRGLNRFILYTQYFADMERMKRELTLQLEALREEPAEEWAPTRYIGGTGINAVAAPAGVIAVNHDYVLVQTDDGRLGVLRSGDVEYSRFIPDMTRRYTVGDRVEGAFLVDPQRGEARYTLLAGQTNPWTVLPSRFPVGTTFHGIVRKSIDKIGLFVGLDGGVNGLVPLASIKGVPPLVGDSVEVVITRMDAAQRRVALRLVPAATQPGTSGSMTRQVEVLPAPGCRVHGTVVRIVAEQDGRAGYLLLRLPQHGRPAMLLAQNMSEDLRSDLNDGQVDMGEEIYVEVASVDTARNRVLLRELPDPQAGQPAAAAA
jgi:small subunit ribosomal protein S1